MTLSESVSYFVQSDKLKSWFDKNDSFLNSLSSLEIEELVFALKNSSTETYFEEDMDSFASFNDKLHDIKVSKEQVILQLQGIREIGKLAIASVLAGVFLIGLVVFIVIGNWMIGVLCLSIAVYSIYKCFKFFDKAERVLKEQDRRYLFSSIRVAKTASELTWAGLFAYNSQSRPNSGTRSNVEIEAEELEVKRLRQELRDSLYRDSSGPFSTHKTVTEPDHPS